MRQHANHKTREMDWDRWLRAPDDVCSLCGDRSGSVDRAAAQKAGLRLPPDTQKLRLDLWFHDASCLVTGGLIMDDATELGPAAQHRSRHDPGGRVPDGHFGTCTGWHEPNLADLEKATRDANLLIQAAQVIARRNIR